MVRYCMAKTPRAIGCYRCGRKGHIAVYCGKGQGQGNELGNCCACSFPYPRVKVHTALPIIKVWGGGEVRVLVDTGCTTTMVRSSLVGE